MYNRSLQFSRTRRVFAGVALAITLTISPAFAQPCSPADLNEDGVLDFFDIQQFLSAFAAQDPQADFAPPAGVFDFFDVQEFLAIFSLGCQFDDCGALGFDGVNLDLSGGEIAFDIDGQLATYQLNGNFDTTILPDGQMFIDNLSFTGQHIDGHDLGSLQLQSAGPGQAFIDPVTLELVDGSVPVLLSINGGLEQLVEFPLTPGISGPDCDDNDGLGLGFCSNTQTESGETWADWFWGRERRSVEQLPNNAGGTYWRYAVARSNRANGPLSIGKFICVQCPSGGGNCPNTLYIFEPATRTWAMLKSQDPGQCTTCPGSYDGKFRLLR